MIMYTKIHCTKTYVTQESATRVPLAVSQAWTERCRCRPVGLHYTVGIKDSAASFFRVLSRRLVSSFFCTFFIIYKDNGEDWDKGYSAYRFREPVVGANRSGAIVATSPMNCLAEILC